MHPLLSFSALAQGLYDSFVHDDISRLLWVADEQ